ncbi:MAG TPA: hypothetical protein VF997_01740 [Polyangia bacterium]
MRIHLAALAVASLFVLAGPRPLTVQALFEGIPLGDLVRPKPASPTTTTTTARPEVPTERNPAISQLSPSTNGGSTPALSTPGAPTPGTTLSTPPVGSSGAPGTTGTLGTPSTSVGGTLTPGVNLANPSLPSSMPSTSTTTGGVPTQSPTPPSTMTLPGSGR